MNTSSLCGSGQLAGIWQSPVPPAPPRWPSPVRLCPPPIHREALSGSEGEMGRGNVDRDKVAQMGKDGWLTLSWPKEFGGQARPPIDGLIFTDEAAIANVPVPFLTINSVAPTIMAFGTDEQKKFFLPKIAAGELHFSIGYSEPGAGTDLAALRTTAVGDGDDHRLT